MTCTGPRPVGTDTYLTDRDRERLASVRGRAVDALPLHVLQEARRELDAMVPFGEMGKARAKQTAKPAKPAKPRKVRQFGYIREGSVSDRICRMLPATAEEALTVYQIAELIEADYHHVSTAIAQLAKSRTVQRRLVPRDIKGRGGRNQCFAYWRKR